MARAEGQSRRARTPAERADEAAEVQRRLKQEAAERREAAAAKPRLKGPETGSLRGPGRGAARRRTP